MSQIYLKVLKIYKYKYKNSLRPTAINSPMTKRALNMAIFKIFFMKMC